MVMGSTKANWLVSWDKFCTKSFQVDGKLPSADSVVASPANAGTSTTAAMPPAKRAYQPKVRQDFQMLFALIFFAPIHITRKYRQENRQSIKPM